VSRKHGHRKRRHKNRKPPAAALERLAAALNECEHAGVRVKFAHGAAWWGDRVILPPVERGQWWVVRKMKP
jgi:hypothetical protein